MSKDRVQGFLLGLSAGVLVACFLKAPEELDAASEKPPYANRDGEPAPGNRAEAASIAHK